MTAYSGEISAADAATVGDDILAINNEQWAQSNQRRILTKVWIVGSTNAGDMIVDVAIGDKIVATLYNTQGGANVVGNRDDEVTIGHYVGSGSPVQLIIRDVPATNPIRYCFWFKP